MILSTAYFPNIQYLSKFYIQNESPVIDIFEHFERKSYRNRCEILSANGVLGLTVPVVKAQRKTIIKDLKLDKSSDWQKKHLKAIESAYNSAPFFEYIMPDFFPVFEKRFEYLIDLNNFIFELLLNYFPNHNSYSFSKSYCQTNYNYDYRNLISPQKNSQALDAHFLSEVYYQTFQDKFPFAENLSCIDLLFNEGSNAESILIKSILK
ncbi:MAG: WbqC family protein [Bacteroidales bacterium]|nr:WbqC family protein [Bacteroidales bacterium]